jgi:hypothetical protein
VLEFTGMSAASPPRIPSIQDIPAGEMNPTVLTLLEVCHGLQEQIQALRDEIARLKGQHPKPLIKPSALEGDRAGERPKRRRKRRGKRSKTRGLAIHQTITIPPQGGVPAGSRSKGNQDFTVQDIRIRLHNTRYRLERWVTPAGVSLIGQLPAQLGGMHFGPELRCFILYQYHHAHVTQPLLLEQVREFGIEVSAGQLSAMITSGHGSLHAEKEALLQAGLQRCAYVHADDTGARHRGRNGYCTHIGNERFAYFASTDSKSRINFLTLLCAGVDVYTVNDKALSYMRAQHLPAAPLRRLAEQAPRATMGHPAWRAMLAALAITEPRHIQTATEGALLGTLIAQGVAPGLAIISDDAGQFDVLQHALCWIHAERNLARLVGFNEEQREALARVRGELWGIYASLKAYQARPGKRARARIEARFETLCTTRTCFATLNQALKRLHRNKAELLRVLERPELPLHNNLSERDIREYVKKRKISGSTRSDEGRRCRDTFASLKKTCRKHDVTFWSYLRDRLFGSGAIPPLADWVFEPGAAAFAGSTDPPRGR